MTTMTRSRPSVKPFSAELVSLECRINGSAYTVQPIPAGEDGSIAFRLSKHDDAGGVYDVVRTHYGAIACDCPDYEARHRGNDYGVCKHGRALVALGLVPAPKGTHQMSPPAPTAPRTVEPIDVAVPEPAGLSSPIDVRDLPAIDGRGLTTEELLRVNGARNRARSVYAQDSPEASPGELDRVADRAATDALRSVLRDRPAAPPLGQAETVTSCCSPAEPIPCAACVEPCEAVRGDESDPETWGSEWDADVWNLGPDDDQGDDEAPGLLTLPELIEQEAARMRRMETHAGDLMAKALADLAGTVRFLNARTPGDVEARLEVLGRTEVREPERHPGDWPL